MSNPPQVPGVEIRAQWRDVRKVEDEELATLEAAVGDDVYAKGKYGEARELFEQVALADDVVEFLTLPAYEQIA